MFGKNSDGLDVKLGGLFRNQQDKNGEVNWRLDKISDKLEQLEMAIENKGYKLPVKPGEHAPSVNEAPKKIVDTPKKGVSFKMAGTLVYLIKVQHVLINFLKFSNLHGLITSCTFINFWKFSSQLDFFTIDF